MSRTPASGLASNSICTVSRVAQQMAHHWCVYQGMVLEQLFTSETSPHFVGTSERLLWTHSALACQVIVCNHLVYCLLQCNAHWHPLQLHHHGHSRPDEWVGLYRPPPATFMEAFMGVLD